MPSLDESFQQLAGYLREPRSMGPAGSDPIFYFIYLPEQSLDVKDRLPVWSAQLWNAGLEVQRVSFSDLVWQLVDASGRWDLWLELESDEDQDKINDSIRDVLTSDNHLINKIAEILEAAKPGTVIFLTETEMLHPYFRVHTLENALHDRIKVPTVIFYPGRRSTQYSLHFLNLYPEDGTYRATLIGGLP